MNYYRILVTNIISVIFMHFRNLPNIFHVQNMRHFHWKAKHQIKTLEGLLFRSISIDLLNFIQIIPRTKHFHNERHSSLPLLSWIVRMFSIETIRLLNWSIHIKN